MGSCALKSDATYLQHSSFELLQPTLFRGTPKVDLMSTVWRPPPFKVRMSQRLFVILSFQQTSLCVTTVLGNLTHMAVPGEPNVNNGVIKRYHNISMQPRMGPPTLVNRPTQPTCIAHFVFVFHNKSTM